MLKEILFDLTPTVADSQDLRKLLNELEKSGIRYILSSEALFSKKINFLAQPPKDYLVLTDLSSGISSARAAGIPCIGYAPPGNIEDMSGAYALFEDFASVDVGYLYRTHAHAVGYPANILLTERLMVREFSEEDFPALYTMCTDPATASYMVETLSDRETEREKHNAYIRNVYPLFDLALWGVFEKNSGRLIGRAGFSLPEDDSGSFSLGYLIDVPYRRRGFAMELIPALLAYAQEQGYTTVSARIKEENHVSIKVLEQCGYPYSYTIDCSIGIRTYTIRLT